MEEQTSDDPFFDGAVQALQRIISVESLCAIRYDSTSALSKDLHALCEQNEKDRTVLALCEKRVIAFALRLESYFEFIATFVQGRPEWRQWILGLIYVIFKTASSYALFAEKISELFESITHLLPNYKQLHTTYRRHSQSQTQHRCERRPMLLSHIYTDLAQLFLELYHMFSRVSHGVTVRHVRLCSPASLWRPLDSRFAQLEARLVRHKVWIENEFGNADQNFATTEKICSEYIEFLDKQAEVDESEELMEQRMAKRTRRVDRAKAWVDNACSYRDIYEHRLKQCHPNTCVWFLNNEKYCRWRNIPFDHRSTDVTERLEHDWQHRVLFVQAEAGFGKSFLSGTVIGDLSTEAGNLSIDDEHEPPTTVFYHFSAAHSYCIHPDDAFRALTDQLLHIHRHDRSTLDAVSLLMRKAPSRAKATPDEVLTILALLLRQHSTFLVIDGIDECSDIELLLRCLRELCKTSDARAILFSRPNVKIPNEYYKWATDAPHIVSLNDDDNKHDVEAYILENLHELADQGYFGISMDRSLITSIAQKSKGNFLWASALLKYLRSPVLSPDERRMKLEAPQKLDGLKAMYAHILALLELRPQAEKRFVASVFRLLALSIHQPCMRGFEKALNVIPGQRTFESSSDFIPIKSIPLLTCGLVEITPCNVVFTHKSVREYLQAIDTPSSTFNLQDESLAHAHLAALCISFLAFDIPKRPLGGTTPHTSQLLQSSSTSTRTTKSGDSGYKSVVSPSGDPFDASLPFLRYATLSWPIHLARALPSAPALPWLTSLSTFLTDRAAVTTWVEASWRYNLPPNLSRLVPLLEAVKNRTPPATVEGRELRWVVHGVRELSEGLRAVKEGWGTRVREDPGLIWGWRGGRGMM